MRSNIPFGLKAAFLALLLPRVSSAVIGPITSVDAGKNGSPPYMLRSVTVGDYTVKADSLATGRSTGEAILLSKITSADNLDLNNIAGRDQSSGPWRITRIDNSETWADTNGDHPDFFLFEAGMNDDFVMQAILADGTLGQGVAVDKSNWGDTGLRRVGLLNLNQPIGGLAFAITDLLDAEGLNLGNESVIRGIQITSSTIDPASFSAVIPEPATVALLGLGGLMILRRRR